MYRPPPHPSPQENSENAVNQSKILLRFFLRGGGGGICTRATFWLLVQILDSSNQKVMGSTLIGSTFSFRATLVTDRKNILIYSPGSKFTIISPSSLRFIFSNISPNGFFL